MEAIRDQIESIRDRFQTKKIFDIRIDQRVLTINEIESIIWLIKNEHEDGSFEINDEIEICLEKGACHIKENPND